MDSLPGLTLRYLYDSAGQYVEYYDREEVEKAFAKSTQPASGDGKGSGTSFTGQEIVNEVLMCISRHTGWASEGTLKQMLEWINRCGEAMAKQQPTPAAEAPAATGFDGKFRMAICADCGGQRGYHRDIIVNGSEHDTEWTECPRCEGTGMLPCDPTAYTIMEDMIELAAEAIHKLQGRVLDWQQMQSSSHFGFYQAHITECRNQAKTALEAALGGLRG